jgi:hypothetical protein
MVHQRVADIAQSHQAHLQRVAREGKIFHCMGLREAIQAPISSSIAPSSFPR